MARTARSKSWPDAKKSDAVDADFRRLGTPGSLLGFGRSRTTRARGVPAPESWAAPHAWRLPAFSSAGLARLAPSGGGIGGFADPKLNGLMRKDRVGAPCPARQRGRGFRAAASREAESVVGEAGTAESAGAGKFDPLSFAGGPTHDLGVVFSCPDRTFAKIGSERWQPKNSERTALI